eukprot:1159425-Pelagomonas_calceolata.AAC.10
MRRHQYEARAAVRGRSMSSQGQASLCFSLAALLGRHSFETLSYGVLQFHLPMEVAHREGSN